MSIWIHFLVTHMFGIWHTRFGTPFMHGSSRWPTTFSYCQKGWPFPWAILPTFLTFSHSHAFKNGGLRMIWDSHSSSMEKPNANEREWAMGFHICTIDVQGIFEGTHRKILRQFMNLNCFTWIFNLVLS